MGHVTIGPEFFNKSLKDYTNWQKAWGRELIQNSIDCGSKSIEFTVTTKDGKTIAVCQNDGPPMDMDTIVNKFLCLGATTKTEGQSVGGFGIAKTLICLAHDQYTIHTGDLQVQGSGGQYEIESVEYRNGTRTTVIMDGDQLFSLVEGLKDIAISSQWNGSLTINGEQVPMTQNKGSLRRELSFAKVYTNNSQKGKIAVRINGLTMFSRSVSLDKMVILELTATSQQVLSTSRDSIRYPYSQELNDFIDEINVDNRSALTRKDPEIFHYPGFKIQRSVFKPESTPRFSSQEMTATRTISAAKVSGEMIAANDHVDSRSYETRSSHNLGHDFVIKNETNLTIPEYYIPNSQKFSDYGKKLAQYWANILIQLHNIKQSSNRFSIGFIFSSEAQAEYSMCSTYGRVYFISPAKIVEQSSTASKSFKKAWLFNNEGKKSLIAVAAHEYVHGMGYTWHNEDYAAVYTDLMGEVLAKVSSFNWCFK